MTTEYALLKVECPHLPDGFVAYQDHDGSYVIFNRKTETVLHIPSLFDMVLGPVNPKFKA